VSKLSDVETVETVEGAEATRTGNEEREQFIPRCWDPHGHLMESSSPRSLRSGGT